MTEETPPVENETPAPDPALQVAATEAVAKAEAAATRRRWINLGEFVAVAGLIIAGISLWMSYADRKADIADKEAEKSAEAGDKARYSVKASVRGNDLMIDADERHTPGDITITFPSALGLGAQSSSTQTIEAAWYESALLKATDGGSDDQTGKLPVLLTVNYMDDDKPLTTTGVFDIVWETHGRMGRGRALRIVGMRLYERGGSQARIDTLWKAARPAG